MERYWFIYKTINLINNKIYIGQHTTKKINDGYLGSGKLLIRAINKYGPENFDRRILHLCKNKEELNKLEKEIVNEEFLQRDDVYNIALGGTGGMTRGNNEYVYVHNGDKTRYILKEELNEFLNNNFKLGVSKKYSESKLGENNPNYGKTYIYNDEHQLMVYPEEIHIYKEVFGYKKGKHPDFCFSGERNGMWGKTHTPEVRKRLSDWRKSKIVVHKDKLIKYIDKQDLEKYLNLGFEKGNGVDALKGTFFIHKGNIEKRIQEHEWEIYKNKGYEKGRKDDYDIAREKNGMFNKTYVSKEETQEQLTIPKEDLDLYLKEGWLNKRLEKYNHSKGKENPMYGKIQSEETKKKISDKLKGKVSWNKGKKVVSKNGLIKYILVEEIENYIKNNWTLGTKG